MLGTSAVVMLSPEHVGVHVDLRAVSGAWQPAVCD